MLHRSSGQISAGEKLFLATTRGHIINMANEEGIIENNYNLVGKFD